MRFSHLSPLTFPALSILLSGCASAASGMAPGHSSGPFRTNEAPSAEAATAKQLWPQFMRSREWPVVGRFESSSHLGRPFSVEVRVSPEISAAYQELTRGQTMPMGSQLRLSLEGNGSPKRYFTAEKRGSDWQFSVLDAAGRIEPTATTLCLRCHAEGRSDSLFGIPSGS